jgi:hypothetical protein
MKPVLFVEIADLGLQGKYKMKLKHLLIPESEEIFSKQKMGGMSEAHRN